jgi:hypothetical protein
MIWGEILISPVPKLYLFAPAFLLCLSFSTTCSSAAEVLPPGNPNRQKFFRDLNVGSDLNEDDITYPIHYAAYVAHAVETGVKDATDLFENIEPELYRKSE